MVEISKEIIGEKNKNLNESDFSIIWQALNNLNKNTERTLDNKNDVYLVWLETKMNQNLNLQLANFFENRLWNNKTLVS
jgi:hypothetical protein